MHSTRPARVSAVGARSSNPSLRIRVDGWFTTRERSPRGERSPRRNRLVDVVSEKLFGLSALDDQLESPVLRPAVFGVVGGDWFFRPVAGRRDTRISDAASDHEILH